jgi:transposase InsO family protein
MARREVQDLVTRCRRLWRRRRRLLTRRLHWTQPGSVWAVDFAEPPLPIEGAYTRLLAVRDLASGCQLAWLPVANEEGATAIAGLEALFREHGAPLVLKSDNGSAFIADEFAHLLSRWKVWQLFSPPRTPSYNGSCEAGIGSMKARTHHQSSARGFPGEWSCDDVEAARLAANQTARPWGNQGPTPEEAWRSHRLVSIEERVVFSNTVQQAEAAARREQGYSHDDGLERMAQAAVNRSAIRRALTEHGLLRVTA